MKNWEIRKNGQLMTERGEGRAAVTITGVLDVGEQAVALTRELESALGSLIPDGREVDVMLAERGDAIAEHFERLAVELRWLADFCAKREGAR